MFMSKYDQTGLVIAIVAGLTGWLPGSITQWEFKNKTKKPPKHFVMSRLTTYYIFFFLQLNCKIQVIYSYIKVCFHLDIKWAANICTQLSTCQSESLYNETLQMIFEFRTDFCPVYFQDQVSSREHSSRYSTDKHGCLFSPPISTPPEERADGSLPFCCRDPDYKRLALA